jgi:hypothetical protein
VVLAVSQTARSEFDGDISDTVTLYTIIPNNDTSKICNNLNHFSVHEKNEVTNTFYVNVLEQINSNIVHVT